MVAAETDLDLGPAEGRVARFSTLFAGVWLFFLVPPAYAHLTPPRGALEYLAGVALIVFVADYLWIFERLRRRRMALAGDLPVGEAWRGIGLMALAACVICVGWQQDGIATAVYLSVAAAMVLPPFHAATVIPIIAAFTLAPHQIDPEDWAEDLYMPLILLASGYVMWGVRQVLARNVELIAARRQNESLLLDRERHRFARDLHDILGHSLTSITVKAELAGRLVRQDPDRAEQEIGEVERLSRAALQEVRDAVAGYRRPTLPGEVARARAGLIAAGIDAHLPLTTDDVAPELRELFAWAVREGVTNVIRHGGAATCSVELGPRRVAIRNDLAGRAEVVYGNGLRGLRERARAVGAEVRVSASVEEGYLLEVLGQ